MHYIKDRTMALDLGAQRPRDVHSLCDLCRKLCGFTQKLKLGA